VTLFVNESLSKAPAVEKVVGGNGASQGEGGQRQRGLHVLARGALRSWMTESAECAGDAHKYQSQKAA
jgi:hypothetical protein